MLLTSVGDNVFIPQRLVARERDLYSQRVLYS